MEGGGAMSEISSANWQFTGSMWGRWQSLTNWSVYLVQRPTIVLYDTHAYPVLVALLTDVDKTAL